MHGYKFVLDVGRYCVGVTTTISETASSSFQCLCLRLFQKCSCEVFIREYSEKEVNLPLHLGLTLFQI
jgi:hypothetical protein